MRKFISILALLFCFNLFLSHLSVANADSSVMVNVKEYGATGDGTTDDTAAIQKAADVARSSTISLNPGVVYTGSSPWLYFPAGHYRISDQINLGSYTNIGSDSKAIIRQTDKTKNILHFGGGYQITVRGLRLIGGKHQIYYSNANLDISTVNIEECEFTLSSDYAIYTIGTARDDTHLSCLMTISRSRFVNPYKVLYNVCDSAVISNCWVQINANNFEENSAAFYNAGGSMYFDNMFGVPSFGANWNSRVRWIDQYGGRLVIDKSRFGAEDAGIPIIRYYAKAQARHPFMGGTVSITNSQLSSGGSNRPDSGVITLVGSVPQVLRIEGCDWVVDAPYIRVDPAFDLKKFLADHPQPNRFKLAIGPNSTWPGTIKIPEELVPFLTYRDAA